MNFYGLTDIGRKRQNNEDCYGIYRIADNAFLLLVCDGMGGEAGGAEASETARNSFAEEMVLQTEDYISGGVLRFPDPEADVRLALDGAAGSANFEVWQKAQDDPTLKGMGTTLVGAFIMTSPLRVWSVNVGDSRLYKINGSGIEQLTRDHSYIQYLVDIGEITEAEAEKRTDRNIIMRAVGISVGVQTDIAEIKVKKGDSLLLCSDGLSGMLTSDEIYGAASSDVSLEERAKKLVSLANEAGGDDNITVLMAEL